jgi:ribosomal protein S18 acetylase RimI-like enzyme
MPENNLTFRRINPDELDALLDLYRHLHESDSPLPDRETLLAAWKDLTTDPKLACLVAEEGGALVAACILVIVPNLTRGARPYGLIENVVTRRESRGRGVGTALLRHALALAWQRNCYKVMLLTGRKDEGTLRFYERAGFRRGEKTGFVAKPDQGHPAGMDE